MIIDPTTRWRQFGEKPDFAGLLSFGGVAYTEDAAELADVDVAVVGAPMDALVSDRPGARLGPRAVRAASCAPGPHLDVEVDPFRELRVVDFGDAAVVPGDPGASHLAIEQIVTEVLDAEALSIVIGGDHSVTEPSLRACNRHFGPLGLVHFDAHTDTAPQVVGAALSHGTWMRRCLEADLVDPQRYVQIGLRGYWPPSDVLEWQRRLGVTSYLMPEVRERGIEQVAEEVADAIGPGPVFISIDVDALDPAYAPGTGTPEPGGLRSDELLTAARILAQSLEVVAADVVEVAPREVGSGDITALVAERLIREVLVGIATADARQLRRQQLPIADAAPTT